MSLPLPPLKSRSDIGNTLLFPFVALTLLALDRFGLQSRFHELLARSDFYYGLAGEAREFYAQCYFWLFCFALFALIPIAYGKIFPAAQGDRWGLGLPPRSAWPAYLIVIALFLPVVFVAAGQKNFQEFYPFFKPRKLTTLLQYEALYLSQFFFVEFFFRGVLLFRLERLFGNLAIFLMTIPYAWLHIHKPFAEAVGSIAAAIILGALALKNRSIWPGFVIHASVALAMDFFALLRSGRLTLYAQS